MALNHSKLNNRLRGEAAHRKDTLDLAKKRSKTLYLKLRDRRNVQSYKDRKDKQKRLRKTIDTLIDPEY